MRWSEMFRSSLKVEMSPLNAYSWQVELCLCKNYYVLPHMSRHFLSCKRYLKKNRKTENTYGTSSELYAKKNMFFLVTQLITECSRAINTNIRMSNLKQSMRKMVFFFQAQKNSVCLAYIFISFNITSSLVMFPPNPRDLDGILGHLKVHRTYLSGLLGMVFYPKDRAKHSQTPGRMYTPKV